MGWLFRKSTSWGPFRLSFSKSGWSGSFGVKGARISTSRRGTFVTLGANGIYYRQRISGNSRATSNPAVSPVVSPSPAPAAYGVNHTITSGVLGNLTDVNSQAFVEELENKYKKKKLFRILGVYPSVVLMLYSLSASVKVIKTEPGYKEVFRVTSSAIFIRDIPAKTGAAVYKAHAGEAFDVIQADTLGWVRVALKGGNSTSGFIRSDLGTKTNEKERTGYAAKTMEPGAKVVNTGLFALLVYWCYYLYRNDRRRKTIEIEYTIDNEVKALHEKFLAYFREFSSSQKIWQNLHQEGMADRR